MEAVGATSSIIAIVDLSAKVAVLCSQYLTAVANARADITRLLEQIKSLETTLQHAKRLLEAPEGHVLLATRELNAPLQQCQDQLERLRTKLVPSTARETMRKFGIRALKWPFTRTDVSETIAVLERHQYTVAFGLQLDQTGLILGMDKKLENLNLQVTSENTPSIARKPHFIMPFSRDPDFVDRPAILTWIEREYAGVASRMALVGLGGFGKSQIAIEFAHRIHLTSPGISVFWVHGGTEARIKESYQSLADALTLPHRHDPNVNILALVRDWLQREDVAPWLLIWDNADDLDTLFNQGKTGNVKQEPLASYLPKTSNGKVLITSRNLNVAERLTGSHKLIRKISNMDSLEAIQIFQNKLSGDFDKDAVSDLVQVLDFIPLAVNQAAAYINRRAPRVSITSYLDDFRRSEKKRKSLLNSDAGDLRRHDGVSNSVVVTWQVTFEQIYHERRAAANLLSLMSFFHPQNIPEYMLSGYNDAALDNGESNSDNNEDLEDDLDVLRAYSLVNFTATSGFCEMHPLVQFCTQAWLSTSDVVGFKRIRSLFLRLCSQHFPDADFENWITCQTLLPHMQPFLQGVPADESDIHNWGELLINLSWYMTEIGDYSTAESVSKMVFHVRKRVLGEEHLGTLRSTSVLAAAYSRQGQWAEAESLLVKIVEINKRVFGEEHRNTLEGLGNLASTYWSQGHLAEAESLEAQVLETYERVLGEEHPVTLIVMSNLASTYREQGRSAEAKSLQVQALKETKRVLGEQHPYTLMNMENLALILRDLGQFEEALALMRDCVSCSRRVLGHGHPVTVSSADILEDWEEDHV